ncbi:MAG: sulfotransferase family protein [Acidimicrobiales bacterium]
MIEAAAPMGEAIELTVDALMAQASATVGLDDFGDDSFLDPFGVLLESLRTEAPLSGFGRITVSVQLDQLLRNRLLLTDLLRRHPEIHDIEIDPPIIIAGLPRTGTTHLQNLISADPAIRSLPYWESVEPFPAPGDEIGADGIDPRITRCDGNLALLDQALPYFPRMFDIGTHHAHEEINLLAIDFSTMYFDTLAPMPTWREHYLAHDQTPHYDYLRTVLKALQFLRGGTRWVLKSPQHLEQFSPLMSIFPDATVVVTHRDPASVVASMATMIAYTARMHLDPVDPVGIGRYWAELLSVMLNSCLANRDVLPSDRSIDVRFDQFMADDLATVERIYDLAAQPFDDSARSAVAAYLAGHQRNRHGALIYDLADFDLDADSIRAGLADYIERFAISIEPVGP